jgi:glycosyltransferase involved in cell wall biosynthesis
VQYADRQNYLLEADAGVSTHMSQVETTFSFRTRILDYLWAGLPMVVTEGDSFADLVREEGLGVVVPAQDVAALESAIERVLFDAEFARVARANVARVCQEFYWTLTRRQIGRQGLSTEPQARAAARPTGPRTMHGCSGTTFEQKD